MNLIFEWHQVAGVAGTLLYIGSYFLMQLGKVSVPGYTYSVMNVAAASLVGISLLYEFNLASALIQISWILISVVGIFRLSLGYHNPRRRTRRRVHSNRRVDTHPSSGFL